MIRKSQHGSAKGEQWAMPAGKGAALRAGLCPSQQQLPPSAAPGRERCHRGWAPAQPGWGVATESGAAWPGAGRPGGQSMGQSVLRGLDTPARSRG